MLEIFGNIWDLAYEYESVVITTNGYVKKNGEAVMGRGIAKEAAERYPWLPKSLGISLTIGPNEPYYYLSMENAPRYLITMPVKPRFGPSGEPGWKVKANIDLIRKSTIALKYLIEYNGLEGKILLPRPGCGNGGLKWEQVKPVIEPFLDDRFTVATFSPL